ncbi:histidine kinase dimerization/phospho-acceptor domain-containing protein [Yinghuangia aomiensis]
MSTTLVLSAAVMVLLGIVVVGQVQGGLLDAKVSSATAQAQGGFQVARQQASGAGRRRRAPACPDGDGQRAGYRRVRCQGLADRPGRPAVQRRQGPVRRGRAQPRRDRQHAGHPLGPALVRQRARRPERAARPAHRSRAAFRGGVPVHPDRARVDRAGRRSGRAPRAWSSARSCRTRRATTTSSTTSSRSPRRRRRSAWYARTLATAGVFLVLLLVAIAALVTRQVVTPVRMAAWIAERLAAGRLEERMRPNGEDDLARLGSSFNKMASTLQNKIRQLEDLSRMQRRFVSDVSHELRTPLTTVRMAADVLHEARGNFDPAVSRSAELLQTQLDRFEALLSDLLEISRFDAAAAVLESDALDLRDLVGRVVDAANRSPRPRQPHRRR